MEATVAERGQITLPKAVRDALGLTKGTQLKVELDGSRIILRKSVDDAISRARGKFALDGFDSADGQFVEKGGVAQQIRLKYLQDTYPATAAATSQPGAGSAQGRSIHNQTGASRTVAQKTCPKAVASGATPKVRNRRPQIPANP